MDYLRLLQLAVFVALGLVAGLLWFKRRSRPAAYLAFAFGFLASGIVLSRLTAPLDGWQQDAGPTVALLGLVAFPWLLAAMVYAFEGPLPAWLRGSAALLMLLALGVPVVLDAADASTGPARSVPQVAFLGAYVLAWTALAAVATLRLLRASGRAGVVRQRMRFMAVGLGTLNVAILLAALGAAAERIDVASITTALSFVAAAAFVVGFAPPLLLRVWWRRRSSQQFQRMQEVLIGAATPSDVAGAVAPMLADLVGGAVAVIGRDGTVEATAHADREQLASDLRRLLSGEDLDGDVQVIEVDAYWLVVRTTPYAPVFGQGERDIVDGLAIQLRLALERAELFQAHLEARAAAETASAELEATLMGLSHDLKSPTAAIAGFAGLLDRAASASDRAHIVAQIQDSTSYLENLVDALLEYSKVGRARVEVEPVDLSMTVASVSRRLAATDPGLIVVVHGELPVVLANPLRAEQVFDNLLGNAAKHGGEGDVTVTLRSEDHADGVRLLVSDDGRGIAAEDEERIFTLFARGSGATRSGSGVGLGMVRRIIESYGGTVQVVAAQGGATFEIVLPESSVVRTDPAARVAGGSVAGRPARN